MTADALRTRAHELGIQTAYVDVDRVTHPTSPATLEALVDLLDHGGDGHPTSGPEAPFQPVVLIRGGRWTAGVASDFGRAVRIEIDIDDGGHVGPVTAADEATLARRLPAASLPIGRHDLVWGEAGADHRVTLLVAPERFPRVRRSQPGCALFTPAYALWTHDDPLPSYDGLARLGERTARFGVDTIATLPLYAPGFGARFDPSPYAPLSRFHWNELFVAPPGTGGGSTSDRSERVDWAAVEARRGAQLDGWVLDAGEARALAAFLAARPDVVSFAAWAGAGDPAIVRRHEVGQWLAEEALASVSTRLRAAGQALALDLPVGARGDSWETATWPHLFVAGACIGAPPDTFFAAGQDWGLPPLSPVASRAEGHRVWYELLRTACRFADVVRIDHVMQVFRLWWVPEGHAADDGAYVHYPADELLAVAAIVAATTGTTMVGEDLGTVPPEVGAALADWGLMGMHEEAFTIHRLAASPPDDPPPLPPVPAATWAGIRTHDMAPLAATVAEVDVGPYVAALARALDRPVDADVGPLLEAMIERLRRAGVHEVVVDLDDVFAVDAAHNVPGVIDAANWSRRLHAPVDEIAADPRLAAALPAEPSPSPVRPARGA